VKTRFATAMILATMGLAQAAAAQDAGEWIVRSGFHSIEPKSGNHALVEVEDEIGLTFNVTYMFTRCKGQSSTWVPPSARQLSSA
jgi:outer membrane protein W